MAVRDPWLSGWALAVGLALLCAGLFVKLIIVGAPPVKPTQHEAAHALLQHALDSVVLELDSVRAACPEQEVEP